MLDKRGKNIILYAGIENGFLPSRQINKISNAIPYLLDDTLNILLFRMLISIKYLLEGTFYRLTIFFVPINFKISAFFEFKF